MGNAFQYIALAVNDGSNVAFHIGNMAIYWYGIIIAAGLIAGVLIGIYEAKRKGYRSEMVLDFILIAIPICIICARLYYVIFEWDMFSPNLLNIFNIRSGGLAIYGAVIGGVIAALIFYRWRRVSIGELLDITAPGLIIGQAIGRWGNFANQEAFGRLITDPKLYWFPYAVHITQNPDFPAGYYQATFFYESMWNLLVFAALMLVRKKIKVRGGVFALYVALYGFGRFWIEQLRSDSLWWGNIRVSEGLSELLFFGGIAYLIYMYFSKRDYFPYKGYYSLGLTEEQIAAMKGKNALMNAQRELEKAEWFTEIMREGKLTSPYYRSVKEKADRISEKAEAIEKELGEDSGKAKAVRMKAQKLEAKAEKIYAKLILEGRLKSAQEEAEKAAARVASLKESDPDGAEMIEAQEKAELANLSVEKIKDAIEADKMSREAWVEKAELNIELLKEKVKAEEEKYLAKTRGKKEDEEDKMKEEKAGIPKDEADADGKAEPESKTGKDTKKSGK